MKRMSVSFYLYRYHDMDLINLYRHENFKFQKEAKKAIVEFANGNLYEIKVPDTPIKSGYIGEVIPMHIEFNANKDDEKKAIELLKSARRGFRCQLIKSLIRMSLETLPLGSFEKNGNGDGFIFKRPNIEDVMADVDRKKVKSNIVDEIPKQKPVPKPEPKINSVDTKNDDVDQNELAAIFGQMEGLTR